MQDYIKQSDIDLAKELGIKSGDLPEARSNLVGFFAVLEKIDQRLKKEEQND